MREHDFEIERDCPVCGRVTLGMDSLAAATFCRDGVASLSFFCPGCGSSLTVSCAVGEETAADLAETVARAVEPAASAEEAAPGPDDASGNGSSEVAPGSSDRPAVNHEPFHYREGRRAHDVGPDAGRGIGIRYTTIRPDSMFRFNMEISPRVDGRRIPAELDEEQLAMMEYFHRQLESLDTVDEAIDEIDSGYNLSDGEDGKE